MMLARWIFPRKVSFVGFWLRLAVAKALVILLAALLVGGFPDLGSGLAVLIAATVLIPLENRFAVYPRAREIGHLATAKRLCSLPIIRELYIGLLSWSVRTPSSCIYANPFDDESPHNT